jgi:hypothetical protein
VGIAFPDEGVASRVGHEVVAGDEVVVLLRAVEGLDRLVDPATCVENEARDL